MQFIYDLFELSVGLTRLVPAYFIDGSGIGSGIS